MIKRRKRREGKAINLLGLTPESTLVLRPWESSSNYWVRPAPSEQKPGWGEQTEDELRRTNTMMVKPLRNCSHTRWNRNKNGKDLSKGMEIQGVNSHRWWHERGGRSGQLHGHTTGTKITLSGNTWVRVGTSNHTAAGSRNALLKSDSSTSRIWDTQTYVQTYQTQVRECG